MLADITKPHAIAVGLCVGAAALVLLAGSAQASVVTTTILSGADWRSSASGPSGWETLAYNDTGWDFARAPYPTGGPGIPGSAAVAIWHDPTGTSDGTTGVTTAFFRYSFDLGDLTPTLAQARISVDDDYAFYVNGTLALLNNDGGNGNLVQSVNFTSLLHSGKNVLAFQAVDGAWGSPFPRGYERLLFDGTVESVPEPATPSLVGLALAAALALTRQRQTTVSRRAGNAQRPTTAAAEHAEPVRSAPAP
jgi:hypothetical protein